MYRLCLERADDALGWRSAARELLLAAIPPEAIVWEAGAGNAGASCGDLFVDAPPADVPTAEDLPPPGTDGAASPGTWTVTPSLPAFPPASRSVFSSAGAAAPADGTLARRTRPRVPHAFPELAERVACHRAPDRFALLYRVLWRLTGAEPDLLSRASDPDVHRLHRLGRAVSRERHKMHAFVRFRRTPGAEPEHYGAWFEPEHHTLRLASGFFVRRFANMHWSIATPAESAHWNGHALSFGRGGAPRVRRSQGEHRGTHAEEEAMESLWRTYFASTFNPARLRVNAMRSEMPVKYWKNLPEAPLIAPLVRDAGRRAGAMLDAAPTSPARFAARATARPAAPVHDGTGEGDPAAGAPHDAHPRKPPPA